MHIIRVYNDNIHRRLCGRFPFFIFIFFVFVDRRRRHFRRRLALVSATAAAAVEERPRAVSTPDRVRFLVAS